MTSGYLMQRARELSEIPLYRWEVRWRGKGGLESEIVEARSEAEAIDKAADDFCWPNYVANVTATRKEQVARSTGREAA